MTFVQWTSDSRMGVKTWIESFGGPSAINTHYTSKNSDTFTRDRHINPRIGKPHRYVKVGDWIIWDDITGRFFRDLEYLPEWDSNKEK